MDMSEQGSDPVYDDFIKFLAKKGYDPAVEVCMHDSSEGGFQGVSGDALDFVEEFLTTHPKYSQAEAESAAGDIGEISDVARNNECDEMYEQAEDMWLDDEPERRAEEWLENEAERAAEEACKKALNERVPFIRKPAIHIDRILFPTFPKPNTDTAPVEPAQPYLDDPWEGGSL